MGVQSLKDTFYAALRDRVAQRNPARTVVVRGIVRPGLVVSENELPGAALDGIAPTDAFCLRWTDLRLDVRGAMPLVTQTCEIRYATDGTLELAGMDRGRALAAMDAELMAAIEMSPQSSAEIVVAEAAGGGAATMTTKETTVFWGDCVFKPVVMRSERMERTAEVEVFCYGE